MMTLKDLYLSIHASESGSVLLTLDNEMLVKKSPYVMIKYQQVMMKPGFYIGTMDIKKHFGFLKLQDEDDIYIDEDYLSSAMQNDVVIVDDRLHRPKIVEIVERGLKHLICTVSKNQYTTYIDPDIELQQLLMIDINQDVVDGHIAYVVIDEITPLHIKGHMDHIIGHENDPDIETMKLVSQYMWPHTFQPVVFDALKGLPKDEDVTLDFENRLIITIDGADAKDLDDAIHIEQTDDGYELGVHIADVSHYVKPNSVIDKEAFERSTSVYLADRVIPMLPHQLSNETCSLHPYSKKKTLSLVMHVSFDGEVLSHNFQSTWIQTTHRLTYDRVNDFILNNKAFDDSKLNESISLFLSLSKTLKKVRDKRGQLNLSSDELGFVIKKDIVKDVYIRKTGPAEELIESMMLLANETTAKHLSTLPIHSIYRTHEHPDVRKLETAFHMMKQLGLRVPSKDLEDKKTMQKVIDESLKHPKQDIIHMIILRAMQKAKYTVERNIHYGLAADYYTHFTSPIRRYPDLIVHRLIHMYVLKDHQIESLDVNAIAQQTSKQERHALSLEREVAQLKSCEYMANQTQTQFNGIIVHTMRRGMFVKISNGIEGFVSLKLFKQRLKYDEETLSYYDRRGIVYRLGDKVSVSLTKVDIDQRKIDFVMNQRKQKRR
ncbi:MAG: ribonuclease R family protein [Acholeplasmataceae bacterium]